MKQFLCCSLIAYSIAYGLILSMNAGIGAITSWNANQACLVTAKADNLKPDC